LEVGVSALGGSIKQLYNDEDFDLNSIMAGALAEVGISSLLKTDVFKDAAETAGNDARVVSRRAEDLASRRSPNSRLVGKAKAAARAAEKKAKGLRSLDNTGKAIKGTIAKTTANKVQNEAKKDE